MSETDDEAVGEGHDGWSPAMMGLYLSSRFPLNPGARQNTRGLVLYMIHLVKMARSEYSQRWQFRRLPPLIRARMRIDFAGALIGNGGVEYLIESAMPPGSWFGEVVRDYRRAGAADAADRLAEVFRLFPGGMPQCDHDERMASLDQLRAAHEDVFDRASEAVWAADKAAFCVASTRVRVALRRLLPKRRKPDPAAKRGVTVPGPT